jgi:hypothetical protein
MFLLVLAAGFSWRWRKQYGTFLEFASVLGSFIGLREWTSSSLNENIFYNSSPRCFIENI